MAHTTTKHPADIMKEYTDYMGNYGFSEDPFPLNDYALRYTYQAGQFGVALSKVIYTSTVPDTTSTFVEGAPGCGKTTVSCVAEEIISKDKKYNVMRIENPSSTTEAKLAKLILEEAFGIERKSGGKNELEAIFKKELKSKMDNGQTNVLMLDEAQQLPNKLLEFVRSMLNYRYKDKPMVKIVLFASDELWPKIQKNAAFRSRISAVCHLDPMSYEDTEGLINHRLKVASNGTNKQLISRMLFNTEALDSIYEHSQGIPRDIIRICRSCLINGKMMNKKKFRKNDILEVVKENRVGDKWEEIEI